MTAQAATQDQDILASLLNAIQTAPRAEVAEEDTSNDNAVDYNWDAPSRFPLSSRDALQKTAKKINRKAVEALDALLDAGLVPSAPTATEYYGRQVSEQVGDSDVYGIAILRAGQEVGLMLVDRAVGAEWTSRMLGGGGINVNAERPLSSMETAVLQDALAAVVDSAAAVLTETGAPSFDAGEKVCVSEAVPDLDPTGEFCKITVQAADKTIAELVLASDLLEPATGSASERKVELSPDEARARMLGHIQHMHLGGAVEVGAARITMRDVVALEPGDVLMLRHRPGEPASLNVAGRELAYGLPAQCQGRYAMHVSATVEEELMDGSAGGTPDPQSAPETETENEPEIDPPHLQAEV
jgi:flagellar motor switch protein FliM